MDLEDYRSVSTRQAHEFASKNWGNQSDDAVFSTGGIEADCFEVSAKNNADVKKIFKRVAEIVLSQAANTREVLDFDMEGSIDLERPGAAPSRCC